MASTTPADPPPSYEDAQRPPPTPTTSSSTAPRPRGPPQPRLPLPLNLPALAALKGKRIILASQSPRRRQLLAQLGLVNLDVVPSNFAEDLPKSLSPLEYVLQTASAKAQDVYKREIDNAAKGEPALIIAADTIIVSHGGMILEKPRSEVDHVNMLQMLRDEGTHKVTTAVAVMAPLESALEPGYRMETHVEETEVKFDSTVTDDLILAYVRTRDGADKAGGYGIQTAGSILIERINGSYDNVVGLPLRNTLKLIEKVMVPEDEEDGFDDDDEDLI
ncbi:Maf-domain-containing protein [Aaosphaeria arxii CBS 175.79]|uniref:Maf-domain-containing protein n=1 Tax=Aaosphaeria arxii CBS 175.79 TaxID=1450172 RepID=A0A6A5XYC8_9PLEO|nr:Maf-domain-containing protein [Aaosphaeria arxii CBS 175.79]KAF2017711.1 Maf-domain-containing protein [Aaosphaeria arxii CBS 175.79]